MNEVSDQGLPGNSSPNGKETNPCKAFQTLLQFTITALSAQGRHKVGELHDAGAEAASSLVK